MGKEKKPKSSKGIPSGPLPWIHEHPEEKGLVRPLGASDNATEMVRWYTGKRKDWWDKYQPQEMAREIQSMVVTELAKLQNRLKVQQKDG